MGTGCSIRNICCALNTDYSNFLELQFFKEEVLLPYRIELVEIFNYNLANNYIDFKKRSKEDLKEKKNYYIYADSYLHLLLILQSASCFQHFFVVKYNPVSQSKKKKKKKKKKS